MKLIIVAEPEEVKLIPLAYKGLPVLIGGVGVMAEISLGLLDPNEIDEIINIGYCGATHGAKTTKGKTFDIDDIESPNIHTFDYFVESEDDLPFESDDGLLVDMEYERIFAWGLKNHVKVKAFKTISDFLNYNEYKESTQNV